MPLRSAWADAGRPRSGSISKVPEITVWFWILKGLSTAVGESSSDFLVHAMSPEAAVVLGFAGFAAALAVQLSRHRYRPWPYWAAVCMVGIFGTMAADVLHVGLGVPYLASAILYAGTLAAVFIAWYRTEGTLSIHHIDTPRRELFYWAAVVSTFAMGTALGDLTGTSLSNGYVLSIVLYAAVILVPVTGFLRFGWNPVLSFWCAYVMTRPLGASLADWAGKPSAAGGLDWGSGRVSVVLSGVIVALVATLARGHAGRRPARGDRRAAPGTT